MSRARPITYARTDEESGTVQAALRILEREARYGTTLFSSPEVVRTAIRDRFRLAIGGEEREVFSCVWLDSQHRAIEWNDLFVGTLSQTSVYPREVVKAALRANAAAVIFAHNHPSGTTEPSVADQTITQTLARALALVDVKVLDHIIVSAAGAMSFAERGLLCGITN